MANNLIMQAAGIPTSWKRHMTIIHYGIQTGHDCFHQHSCDTVETLKPKKQFYALAEAQHVMW